MTFRTLGNLASLGRLGARLTGGRTFSRRTRLAFYASAAVLAVAGLVKSVDMVTVKSQGYLHYDVYNVAELRIAATALSTTTFGGIIRLEPGDYDLGTTPLATFSSAENVTIIGSGRGTRIIYRGTGAALDFTSTKRMHVADLAVLGMTTGEYGIRIASGLHNTVENTWAEGFTKNGLRFEGGSANTVRNSTFYANGEAQIHVATSSYLNILNNRLYGTSASRMVGAIGAELVNVQQSVFSGNSVAWVDVGLKVSGNSAWDRYEDNDIGTTQMEGVLLDGTASGAYFYHHTFTGNQITSVSLLSSGTYAGVRAKSTAFVVFTANQLFPRGSTYASNQVWLESNNSRWIFRDNILRFSAGTGHVLSSPTNLYLQGFDASSNYGETPAQILQ